MRVADYLLAKDDLFARLTLDDEEYGLYRQVHDRLAIDAPQPDLVVYLQAPVDVLLDRIARRGIAHESLIDRAYLTRLNEAYARFFHDYDAQPAADRQCRQHRPDQQRGGLRGAAGRRSAARCAGRLYYNPLRHTGPVRRQAFAMYTQLQLRDSARPPVTLTTLRQDARGRRGHRRADLL